MNTGLFVAAVARRRDDRPRLAAYRDKVRRQWLATTETFTLRQKAGRALKLQLLNRR